VQARRQNVATSQRHDAARELNSDRGAGELNSHRAARVERRGVGLACGRAQQRRSSVEALALYVNAWDAWKYANWRARTFKPCAPPWATPYSCRHGFASLLIREGRTLADVARLMGHSPTMTTQHYTHVFEQYQGQPSQRMEKLVKAARSVRKVSRASAAPTK
jgi:integrase